MTIFGKKTYPYSWRLITMLTPSRFGSPIVVISTVFGAGGGETSVAKVSALNYLCVDLTKLEFETAQTHTDEKEAKRTHTRIARKFDW